MLQGTAVCPVLVLGSPRRLYVTQSTEKPYLHSANFYVFYAFKLKYINIMYKLLNDFHLAEYFIGL